MLLSTGVSRAKVIRDRGSSAMHGLGIGRSVQQNTVVFRSSCLSIALVYIGMSISIGHEGY